MNEVEYMLRRDMREKKAAGRGIYHKRNGSRTKHVSLPQDHMTEAQWKRRNGPVQSYNISRVIRSYETFKALPKDLAAMYLANLRDGYNVSLVPIAKSMSISPATLRTYIRTNAIPSPFKTGNHGEPDPSWEDFLAEKRNSKGEWIANPITEEPTPEPEIVSTPAPEPTPIPEPDKPTKLRPTNFTFNADGTTEELLDLIMDMLADLTTPSAKYSLHFALYEKAGDDFS